jgi:BirA family biotin operon repressor/biotin-[acetyl-CoA-carboxylase] ligase
LPFIELQTVDSTNNYALEQVHAGLAVHGMAIFAHDQSAGKGQRGRKWASRPGENIALSLVLQPSLPAGQQFQLSATVALALQRFFQDFTGGNPSIKWPNDLYWEDRKAGGILIENIIRSPGHWAWAIVGIGVNINQEAFSPDLPNPVSLLQITGRKHDPAGLARQICQYVDQAYRQLLDGKFTLVYDEYVSRLYRLHQYQKFARGNRVFEAEVRGVTPAGKLVLYHGIEEEIEFGDIEWRIDQHPKS